jgi:DNA (cytosine-5)-methyltransferase 1
VVYNLSVSEDESYVADGIVVHNCVHHSNARGGRPMNEQSRASAWHILRWAEALYIDNIMVENVREFQFWGPLGANGRPLKSKRGELFEQFIRSLRALGYRVDYRVFNAADYGDATSRSRLFIQARRGRPIRWPDPTHSKITSDPSLFATRPWRPAREIIDWSIASPSIYSRKKPLAPNTMRRIMAGLRKFSGLPFVIGQQSCAAPRGLNHPIPTIATAGAISLVEPFLMALDYKGAKGDYVYGMERPVPAITTRGQLSLVQPFIVVFRNFQDAKSIDDPLATMTASGANFGLCQPFLVQYNTEREGENPRVLSVDEPLGVIPTENRFGLAQPFLIKYNKTGGPCSVDAPLDTVVSHDRFALITPELLDKGDHPVAYLDIRFRMLQPSELAAAMSFPTDYQFTGNRGDRVKQIGNAVAVNLAAALTGAMLQDYRTERKAA